MAVRRAILGACCFFPTWAAAQGGKCVHGQRGPPCHGNSDCSHISDCVRCASSGFCTDVPLGPSPSPGPGPSPGPHGSGGCTANNKSYDYFTLVQGWPASQCQTTNCRPEYGSISDRFTMHGLWPSRDGSAANSYPCECDKRGFDASQVSSIMDDLNKNWPTFKGGQKDAENFWEHEWTKHGTCASDNPRLSTELKFFQTTLALKKEYDIFKALSDAGITPNNSKTYDASSILGALKKVTGLEPDLGCILKHRHQYLHEVSYCLDKSLKVIECDEGIKNVKGDEVSNCDLSKPIIFSEPKKNDDALLV